MRPPILWPRMEECEVPRSKIVMNRTIGQGQFGTVYGGEVEGKDGVWVAAAIKTLKVGSTDEDKLDFLQEAKMMKSLDHPNIIKLLALCLVKEPILMVMEFMLHGKNFYFIIIIIIWGTLFKKNLGKLFSEKFVWMIKEWHKLFFLVS